MAQPIPASGTRWRKFRYSAGIAVANGNRKTIKQPGGQNELPRMRLQSAGNTPARDDVARTPARDSHARRCEAPMLSAAERIAINPCQLPERLPYTPARAYIMLHGDSRSAPPRG